MRHTYYRVIPRDLFNEANLLKCLGRLVLAADTLSELDVTHDDGPFRVEQNPDTGGLYCTNVRFFWKGQLMELERPLNSREPWPLYWVNSEEEIEVFDSEGNVILGEVLHVT